MCGDDMACHDSCPLPSCPKMAAKVKGILGVTSFWVHHVFLGAFLDISSNPFPAWTLLSIPPFELAGRILDCLEVVWRWNNFDLPHISINLNSHSRPCLNFEGFIHFRLTGHTQIPSKMVNFPAPFFSQWWGIVQCNQQCGSDGRCREVCNRPVKMFIDRCSRFAQRDVPHGFHERVEHFKPPPAQFIVSKFRVCHAKCGDDVLCKEQCPKPFWMKFKTTCDEAIPIMECHQTCGHDHECHQKCPLPSCPHMKAQVEETMKCHGQCGADRECHHMCPKPMKKILMKCKAFTECQGCHEKCHDFSCHRECPKARLWKFFGKHGFGYHDDFHHHHDGNFHHHHDGNFHHHHDGNFHHHHDDDFHHQHDGNFHHHHDGNFHHHHDGNFHHHHDGNFHHHHDGNFHHHHDNDGDFHRAPVAPTLPIAPRAPLIATVAWLVDPLDEFWFGVSRNGPRIQRKGDFSCGSAVSDKESILRKGELLFEFWF